MGRPSKAPEQRKGHHKNKPLMELVRPDGPAPVDVWIMPVPPDYIAVRPGGVEVWEDVWRAGGHGYVPEFDRHVVEIYVDKWLDRRDLAERRAEMLERIAEVGDFIEGSKGQPVRNPMFAEVRGIAGDMRTLERDLVRLSDKLGRNPEARIRLGLGIKQLRTSLDEFLDG